MVYSTDAGERAKRKRTIVKALRENHHMPDDEIVRRLAWGVPASGMQALAEEWCPILGLSKGDFTLMAGPRSRPRGAD